MVASIRRADFLNFLARHLQAYQAITEELAGAISPPAPSCAPSDCLPPYPRSLPDWCENGRAADRGMRCCFPFTHEEIGEFIGASREMVTRILGAFKRRNLVAFHGGMSPFPIGRRWCRRQAGHGRGRQSRLPENGSRRQMAGMEFRLPFHGTASVSCRCTASVLLQAQ